VGVLVVWAVCVDFLQLHVVSAMQRAGSESFSEVTVKRRPSGVYAHYFCFLFFFCQKNVPSASRDPSFLRMIMTQVLRHAVGEPQSADFTVSGRVAILAGLVLSMGGLPQAGGG